MKICFVIGTRPNIIKIGPIIRELKNRLEKEITILHTGQHYDYNLSRIFMEELELPEIDQNLDVGSGRHGEQVGKIIVDLEKSLLHLKPDVVVIPGDTNSSMASALAAVKISIPVAHVESGVRYESYYHCKRSILEPEQINRAVIDHISDFLLCPSEKSVQNLEREGAPENNVFLTGDTMLDAVNQNIKIAEGKVDFSRFGVEPKEYILVTSHRPWNVDDPQDLKNILDGLDVCGCKVLFPVHPRTKSSLDKLQIENYKNLIFIEPVGYFDMLVLAKNCNLVVTDSGGMQKEAFYAGAPCITLKDETEWIETIEVGANMLLGWRPPKGKIHLAVEEMMKREIDFKNNPYGDGKASEKMIDALEECL